MKKLLNKLKRRKDDGQAPSRITSETVAEHRERILAGGRRYKYPIQYVRHKLVINTIAISVLALVTISAIGWWQLYKAQSTSVFMYRVTRVIPVPVASVDNQPVLYSDYLMGYISSAHYLEQIERVSLKTADGKRQVEYIKQKSLSDAVADAYAVKMANKMGISVSDKELEIFLKEQRQSVDGEISEKTFYTVIMDYYGWSSSEWRYVTKRKLLRQKVAYEMDKNASSVADEIKHALDADQASDFNALAEKFSKQSNLTVTYKDTGWLPKVNQDGGLTLASTKMIKGQISDAIKPSTGDGYYFIRLKDIGDTKVNYEYIKIPLTAFDDALKKIEDGHKVKCYISVKLI